MTEIQYKLTLQCRECDREIEKYAKFRHSSVLMGECQGCGTVDVVFEQTAIENIEFDEVPGVGVA